jgi:hypothetical protein
LISSCCFESSTVYSLLGLGLSRNFIVKESPVLTAHCSVTHSPVDLVHPLR